RKDMVRDQLEARGIRDPRVLNAMREVERHLFVPDRLKKYSYEDQPLPIGHSQTISQPYIVAFMTELSNLQSGDKVLEIGTGSGYQAAVLAAMGCEVYSIEIVKELAEEASQRLRELGIDRVHVRDGDGYAGWPEQAPFDAILVTAAPPYIPEPLKQQLRVGGRLVIPVGQFFQELLLIERTEKGFEEKKTLPVRFVPMTGEAQE
ncbi:MAG: protein-L-isoaspartate(D-aspartate) O-methyltransferase, partial [Deltaproteobacteria bacterium]|nr:protein-L-isoaspartate(D-aspartate) O-methyltransferase [Deltaproteobacteria bacterium]